MRPICFGLRTLSIIKAKNLIVQFPPALPIQFLFVALCLFSVRLFYNFFSRAGFVIPCRYHFYNAYQLRRSPRTKNMDLLP
jgi:hypothetical protein